MINAVRFIRPRVSLTGAIVALFGFMLFNPINSNALLVFAAGFCVTAFAYSYNTITDTEEDNANQKTNPLAYSRKGLVLSALLAFAGVVFAGQLGPETLMAYGLTATVSFVYSYFRIKKFFPWKSIYVGFGYTTIFFIGASVAPITSETVLYYFIISSIIFGMGTIADLRDRSGDKKTNVPTLPVKLGKEKSKLIIYASFLLPTALITGFNIFTMFAVIPFAFAAIILLQRDMRPQIAHNYMRVAVLLLPLLLFINKIGR